MAVAVIPRYSSNSHLVIELQISSGPILSSEFLALKTSVTTPAMAIKTPQASRCRNRSFSSHGAIMQLEIRATTPNGDTIDAGAKPYLAKVSGVLRSWKLERTPGSYQLPL